MEKYIIRHYFGRNLYVSAPPQGDKKLPLEIPLYRFVPYGAQNRTSGIMNREVFRRIAGGVKHGCGAEGEAAKSGLEERDQDKPGKRDKGGKEPKEKAGRSGKRRRKTKGTERQGGDGLKTETHSEREREGA